NTPQVGASEPFQGSDRSSLIVNLAFAAFALVLDLVPWIEKKPIDTVPNDRIARSLEDPFNCRVLFLLARVLVDEDEHFFDPCVGTLFVRQRQVPCGFADEVFAQNVPDVGRDSHLKRRNRGAMLVADRQRGQQLKSKARLAMAWHAGNRD